MRVSASPSSSHRPNPHLAIHHAVLLDGDGALVGRIVVGGIQVDDRAWPTCELEKVLDPVAVRRLTTTRRADDQLTETHRGECREGAPRTLPETSSLT